MSLRQVLTIYNAERQLSDDETALLNTLRRFTDAERALFVEQLSDKPQKKSSKKSTVGGGKSKRGESLKGQLDNRRQGQRKATADDNGGLCVKCEEPPDHNVHHLSNHHNYHVFEALQPPAPRCAFRVTDIERCGATEHDPIHDAATNPETYHEFQPVATSAAGSGG